MARVLSYFNDASSPVSHLESTSRVNAEDLFIVEDLAMKPKDAAILTKSKLSAIMLNFGVDDLDDPALAPLIAEFKLSSEEFKHYPYKLSYDTLSASLLEDIRRALGLGTMAYRESYQHSKMSHEHDYSKVECFTNYKLSDATDDPDAELSTLSSWLGTLNIWRKETVSSDYLPARHDVFMPKIQLPSYETPQVGELRFAVQTNSFTQLTSDEGEIEETRCSCDIAFLIDYTGSMGTPIKTVAASLESFFDDLDNIFAENDIDDWRACVVGYKDKTVDDPWFTIASKFTRDISQLKNGVLSLSPDGGGDAPESTVDAMNQAMDFGDSALGGAEDETKWRPFSDSESAYGQLERILIVFTDADTKGNIYDTIARARSSNFKIVLIAPQQSSYDKLYENDDITIKTYLGGDPTRKYANISDFNAKPTDILKNLAEMMVEKFEVTPPEAPEKYIYIEPFKDGGLLLATSSYGDGGLINVNPYNSDGKIRSDYDGWMFPNGATVQNIGNQLSDAAKVFVGDWRAEQFTLPAISNFIHAFSQEGSLDSKLSAFPQQVGLKEHDHTVDKLKFAFTSATLDQRSKKLWTTSGNGGPSWIHEGAPGIEKVVKVDNVMVELGTEALNRIKTTDSATESQEPYPTHDLIPLMIYVGGETLEYYENL